MDYKCMAHLGPWRRCREQATTWALFIEGDEPVWRLRCEAHTAVLLLTREDIEDLPFDLPGHEPQEADHA